MAAMIMTMGMMSQPLTKEEREERDERLRQRDQCRADTLKLMYEQRHKEYEVQAAPLREDRLARKRANFAKRNKV